ncbi:MAG: hypothetical protein PHV36_11860 [Elusimicrobiales bacterium]|nr:hypothetical protein [Elusimicrobiales bacterium]
MTLNELKARLTPAGILLLLYFLAPLFVQMFMGVHDTIYGSLTFSVVVQVGLGFGVAYKLFALKDPFKTELTAWLKKFAQPPEKVLALAEKISLAAVLLIIVAVVWPPVGEIITNGKIMTLLKLGVLGYAGCLGYDIWKLAQPFIAYVPPPAPREDEEAPHEKTNERRCPKCGQILPEAGEFCTFCWHQINGGK